MDRDDIQGRLEQCLDATRTTRSPVNARPHTTEHFPDHPLTAARIEHIEDRGGNSFMEYSVPEAVLKLRQGIGRLIRTRKDKGIAVILDPRIMTKTYGKTFLEALPPAPREVVG